jgi:hypothetical protein
MTTSALQSELRTSRARLFELIRGLTEEQFRFVDTDGWSIATHLAHLLRCERMLVERCALARSEDGARVASTGITNDDDPGLAQRLAVPQIIHGMQASRRDLEALLQACGEAELEQAIAHERLGRVTVRDMVTKAAVHEREHADAVASTVERAPAAPTVIHLAQRG